jgi:hypothetical protein
MFSNVYDIYGVEILTNMHKKRNSEFTQLLNHLKRHINS